MGRCGRSADVRQSRIGLAATVAQVYGKVAAREGRLHDYMRASLAYKDQRGTRKEGVLTTIYPTS
jgi:hypothetical protein